MMDMFKLLTRSSNIQKSAPAPMESSNRCIPSHGFLGHSQRVDGNAAIFYKEAKRRGLKRKRDEVGGKRSDGILGRSDVFEEDPQYSVSSKKQAMNNVEENLIRNSDVRSARIQTTVTPNLGEEDSRRILKEHKLKITILNSAPEIHHCHRAKQGGAHPATAGKKAHPQVLPQPLTSFAQLRSKYSISRRLSENLAGQGYTEPSEVQMGCLPILLGTDEDSGLCSLRVKKREGESRSVIDLLTIAPTGSGKTLGFMIHLLHGILESREVQKVTKADTRSEHKVQALIIAPTHELADQIVNEGRKLASGTGVKILGLRKGMRLHPELVGVKHGDTSECVKDHSSGGHSNDFLVKTDIVVSTPLIFLHAISADQSITVPLPDVRFLVLDEADVLLDPIFRDQTLAIWTACTSPSLCTSLWSATIGSSIESFVQTFIINRRRCLGLSCSSSSQHYIVRLVVGLKDSAIPNVAHRIIYAASERGKLLALRQILHPSGGRAADAPSLQPPFLVFTQTITRAIALHSELLYDIPPEAGGSSRIAVLHADLSDTARSNVVARFRRGEIWILITTDLLSRGVDFRGLNGVVNYDIPNTGASYVHRIGRTGRQGREGGIAVTLYTKEDIPYIKNVANVIAVSERVKEKHIHDDNYGDGMEKWLLGTLPNVSKKTKKEARIKGVESRRVTARDVGAIGARKMRISTKSGYDRRLENKRKGAVAGSRRRQKEEGSRLDDEEWEGIDD